jgi:molybdopterin-guanine dinucleotide biosynthesis adapter protein
LCADQEPPLDQLLGQFQACDLVLIEGFKQGNFPKLEVWRAAVDKSTLWPGLPGIAGIATDDSVDVSGLPILALSDIAGIADFIVEHAAESVDRLEAVARHQSAQLFMV